MLARELKQKYFQFFQQKGHRLIPSAPLVPENDPTCLFITAGMHPLVPFLMGETHPEGKRLVNAQKCIRTGDIEDVGDNTHNTFFEMLGNWSLGDYFKEEAISWSWEFLTDPKWLGLDPNKLYVTVFQGDQNVSKDTEAILLWQKQFKKAGVTARENERIFPLPKEDNWWGPAGQTGPCGPDTEMFYDTGREKCDKQCKPGCHCGKYVEIWNDVFMEYNKKLKVKSEKLKVAEYEYELLKQKNVDTGMGLERTTAVLNGFDNVYATELFQPILKKISQLSNVKCQLSNVPSRIIADHLRSAVFLIADGVLPSNLDQGYVLRRLIRRTIRQAKLLEIQTSFTAQIAQVVIDEYKEDYPALWQQHEKILETLNKEEAQFHKTLASGIGEVKKLLEKKKVLSGKEAFYLYETYGFPLEMLEEEIKTQGFKLENVNLFRDEFVEALKHHQQRSRAGAEGRFAGGLADHSEKVTKLHTATHLLNAALKKVLGDHVYQKGSNITEERLRFDFPHPQKLTMEELRKVETLVNEQIQKGLPVEKLETSFEEAEKMGAVGVFKDRYGERVKVYCIGKDCDRFSLEVCGGPHVDNTKKLGYFKIIKEEAVGAGVRRIKAVLE
ncbi:alanine--tRNA ligase [Candidatus Peregrinibacteria bacterium CG1_02_41_10]|nr:MAG: alanine--tRNA ligase [Candidatus Peregrinibacteria bacterium CG1_02_41_10]